jgi:hypothetical protein
VLEFDSTFCVFRGRERFRPWQMGKIRALIFFGGGLPIPNDTTVIERRTVSSSHLMTSTVLLRLTIRRLVPRFQPCILSLRAVNRSPNSLLYRQLRHLSTPAFAKPHPPTLSGPKGGPRSDDSSAGKVTIQEQRKKDWSIMRRMMEHLWPQDWGVRSRVVLGLGLLVGGKVNRMLNSIVFLLSISRIPSC